MTPNLPITLLLVDDHQLVRDGLKALLENYPEFAIVAEAANSPDALRQAILHKPDVVLMDIKLPGNDGIRACRRILAAVPQTKVIILTGYEDEAMLTAAIEAGAVGYVTKTIQAEPLVNGIKLVAAGGATVDPRLGMALFQNIRKRQIKPMTGAVALADFIHSAFDLAGLKELCFRLGINYDDLPGDTHQLKVIELVLNCERSDTVGRLEQVVGRMRPNFKSRQHDNLK